MIILMYRQAHLDNLDRILITDTNFPSETEDFKLFFISDIHKRVVKKETIQQIDLIDAVIIGGDLCEKGVSFENIKQNIEMLKSIGSPIFFIWGNNDYEVNYRELDVLLRDLGVIILADSSTTLHLKNGKTISVVGLDSDSVKEINVDVAFEGVAGNYTILAIHDPKTYEWLSVEQKSKVNLVVSGHTHGGQIRLFNWGIFPRGSFRKVHGTYFLISEGYGTTGVPLRLGTRSECHMIMISH